MNFCSREPEVAHARLRLSDYAGVPRPNEGTPECKLGGCRRRAYTDGKEPRICMDFCSHKHQVAHAWRLNNVYLAKKPPGPHPKCKHEECSADAAEWRDTATALNSAAGGARCGTASLEVIPPPGHCRNDQGARWPASLQPRSQPSSTPRQQPPNGERQRESAGSLFTNELVLLPRASRRVLFAAEGRRLSAG